MTPLLTEGLTVGYTHGRTTVEVLRDLDLTIAAGELVCLVGPNGSGKSTLLRTIAGMQPALAGRALLQGGDVTALAAGERARRLAVVLTDPVDVGAMTAAELVALGRYPHTDWTGRLGAADHAAITWALQSTGATPLAGRPVAELSDGERQRVLLSRALAQQPALLALDEAVAFVDVPRRVELVQILRNLARECGLAVLLTTHDLDLAIRHADTLWLLEPGSPTSMLHAGGPEDLVLAGAVGRAFAGDEVTFDVQRGVFVPIPAQLATVAVTGTGLAADWTRRAMVREGLSVVNDAEITVVVDADGWTVRTANDRQHAHSIAAAVKLVREALPGLAVSPSAARRSGGPLPQDAGPPGDTA